MKSIWFSLQLLFFILLAIVTGPFNRLMAYIGIRFNSYWYCTIKVKQNEYDAYNALQWYVASQLGEKSFRHVEKIFFIVVSWLYHFFDNDRKLGYKKTTTPITTIWTMWTDLPMRFRVIMWPQPNCRTFLSTIWTSYKPTHHLSNVFLASSLGFWNSQGRSGTCKHRLSTRNKTTNVQGKSTM